MDFKQNSYELSMERFQVFQAQDSENGDFDAVFDIAGKKLYAHKSILTLISTTFKSMLSDRWSKPDEPVKIKGYTFEDFKEFLTFIYSGKCQLTDSNIFAMTDIAEFYCIKVFKIECEEFLVRTPLNMINVFQMIELACKYTMEKLKTPTMDFVSKNISYLLKSEKFFGLEKCTVKEVVESNYKTLKQEVLFEAIYKWAEKHAKKCLEAENSSDLNDAIKEAFSEFKPFIYFELMKHQLLNSNVLRKSFLFSDLELSNIIMNQSEVNVQIIDENGRKMRSKLQCSEITNFIDVIKLQKDVGCYYSYGEEYHYWNTEVIKPPKLSKVIKNERVGRYLVYDSFGNLSVKRNYLIVDEDYLLAELIAEDGFFLYRGCTIEIV